jgi:drug/metabolite transporter (DMT)-like permease
MSAAPVLTAARPVSHRAAVAMLVVVVIAWGLAWPVNKLILEALSPLWTAAIRAAIGTLALFAIAAATGRLVVPPRADLPVVLSISLLHMVGFVVLSSIGLQLVSTGRSVVLAYTTPLWIVPGARVFLGERITARRALGAVMGLLGLAALFNPLAFDWSDRLAVLGNLALLGAALCWAASILHIRGHRWRSTAFELAPWEGLLATVVLMPAALAVDGWPAVRWTTQLTLLLLYGGIPGMAIAYWATAVASRGLPAVTMSLGLLAAPLLSILTATVALGEPVSAALIAAVVLIIGGVAVGASVRAGPR